MMLVYFFLAGVVADFTISLNYRLVQHKKTLAAMLSSFMAIFLALTVIKEILAQGDSFESILAYSAGVAVGTYLALQVDVDT